MKKSKNIFAIFAKIVGILMFIVVVGVLGAFYWYQSNLNHRNETSSEIIFTVAPNETLDNILVSLKDKGFEIDKTVWQIFLKLNPTLGTNIQAGDFGLNSNMSVPDVIQALQKANIKKGIKVTIQEGLRYDEIATIIDKGFSTADPTKRIFTKTEFLRIVEKPILSEFNTTVKDFLSRNKPEGVNLEGYLFPDTYYFDESATAISIIEKLVTTLSMKLSAEDLKVIYASKYSFHEYLTVASLIERETLTMAEKPMVADVIYKRLENGIDGVKMLQFCSTMLYIIKDWKADDQITEALKEKYKTNPYNTYRVAGLPPTPISNPGLSALKAAIYPEANDYYFFLHDANGVIHYGRNLSEHNANVRKYL